MDIPKYGPSNAGFQFACHIHRPLKVKRRYAITNDQNHWYRKSIPKTEMSITGIETPLGKATL